MKNIGSIIFAVCCVVLFLFFVFGNINTTADDFAKDAVKQLDEYLQQPRNEVVKRIENAHGTVTCKSVKVTGYRVTTKDGSNKAGSNNSNIAFLEIWITAYWDGYFHKNGHTVIYGKIDVANQYKCVASNITETDALINFEDPKLWFAVGELMGEALFAL